MKCIYYEPWLKLPDSICATMECWYYDHYSLQCTNQDNVHYRNDQCPWYGYPESDKEVMMKWMAS